MWYKIPLKDPSSTKEEDLGWRRVGEDGNPSSHYTYCHLAEHSPAVNRLGGENILNATITSLLGHQPPGLLKKEQLVWSKMLWKSLTETPAPHVYPALKVHRNSTEHNNSGQLGQNDGDQNMYLLHLLILSPLLYERLDATLKKIGLCKLGLFRHDWTREDLFFLSD